MKDKENIKINTEKGAERKVKKNLEHVKNTKGWVLLVQKIYIMMKKKEFFFFFGC